MVLLQTQVSPQPACALSRRPEFGGEARHVPGSNDQHKAEAEVLQLPAHLQQAVLLGQLIQPGAIDQTYKN